MSTYRQSVHDYIRACETLIATADLTGHEMQAVEAMMKQLSDAMRSSGEDLHP